MSKQERSLNKAVSASMLLPLLLTACDVSVTYTPNQEPKPGETALAPTPSADLITETASPETPSAPSFPIIGLNETDFINEFPDAHLFLTESIQNMDWVDGKPVELSALIFSPPSNEPPEVVILANIDGFPHIALRSQVLKGQKDEDDYIHTQIEMSPLFVSQDEQGNTLYFTALEDEQGNPIANPFLKEVTTADGNQETWGYMADGTIVKSPTDLSNPFSIRGKLALAIPMQNLISLPKFDEALNTYTATNIEGQTLFWNEGEWIILPIESIPEFELDLTQNPESVADISGEIRQESLSEDLGALADQMLAQADSLGIDYQKVPVFFFENDQITASQSFWEFFPWIYDQAVFLTNNYQSNYKTNERHMVLTQLTDENQPIGYVLSSLVRLDPVYKPYLESGTDELRVIHAVFDENIIIKLNELRDQTSSTFPPIPTIKDKLTEYLPNLNLKQTVKIFNDTVNLVVIGPSDPDKPQIIDPNYASRLYYDRYLCNDGDTQCNREYIQNLFSNLENKYLLAWNLYIKPLSD